MNSEIIDGNEEGFSGSSACEYLGIMTYILMRSAVKQGVNREFLSRACLSPSLNSLEDFSWMDWDKDISCDDIRVSDVFLIFRKKRNYVDFKFDLKRACILCL